MDKFKKILSHLLAVFLVSSIPVFIASLLFYNYGFKKGFDSPPEEKLMTACNRISPYEIETSLKESLDLIFENYRSSSYFEKDERDFYLSMRNCIYLQYDKLSTEKEKISGTFVPRNSNQQKLYISMDSKYSSLDYDVYDRIFVLVHEMTHAKQYYEYTRLGVAKLQIDKETEAFRQEIIFFMSLDEKTKKELSKRANAFSSNPQDRNIRSFMDKDKKARSFCGEIQDGCYWGKIDELIRTEAVDLRGYPDDLKK